MSKRPGPDFTHHIRTKRRRNRTNRMQAPHYFQQLLYTEQLNAEYEIAHMENEDLISHQLRQEETDRLRQHQAAGGQSQHTSCYRRLHDHTGQIYYHTSFI